MILNKNMYANICFETFGIFSSSRLNKMFHLKKIGSGIHWLKDFVQGCLTYRLFWVNSDTFLSVTLTD